MTPLSIEIRRKAIHLSSLWMAAALWFAPQPDITVFFGLMAVTVLTIDLLRRHYPPVTRLFSRFFGGLLREHEKQKLTGAFYVCLAAFLAALLFSKPVAVAALGIMLVADSMAALIGRRWGKTPLIAGKSLEGSLAFFISALAITAAMTGIAGQSIVFFMAGCVGALAATLAELYSARLKIDDNLTTVLAAGTAMEMALIF